MEEIVKVRILYQDAEYELEEQELDRIIAMASKKLRDEIVASKLGLGIFSVKNLTEEAKLNPGMRVMKNSYESELYGAMKETLLYAIETDMLEPYRLSGLSIKAVTQITPIASTMKQKRIINKDIGDVKVNRDIRDMSMRNIDIAEIYSRRLHNFFELISREIFQ